jgi:hypothetical protein
MIKLHWIYGSAAKGIILGIWTENGSQEDLGTQSFRMSFNIHVCLNSAWHTISKVWQHIFLGRGITPKYAERNSLDPRAGALKIPASVFPRPEKYVILFTNSGS